MNFIRKNMKLQLVTLTMSKPFVLNFAILISIFVCSLTLFSITALDPYIDGDESSQIEAFANYPQFLDFVEKFRFIFILRPQLWIAYSLGFDNLDLQIFSAFISSVCCILIYFVAYKITKARMISLLAPVILATGDFFLNTISGWGVFVYAQFYLLALLLICFSLLSYERKGWSITAAVLSFLSAVANPQAALLICGIVVGGFLSHTDWRNIKVNSPTKSFQTLLHSRATRQSLIIAVSGIIGVIVYLTFFPHAQIGNPRPSIAHLFVPAGSTSFEALAWAIQAQIDLVLNIFDFAKQTKSRQLLAVIYACFLVFGCFAGLSTRVGRIIVVSFIVCSILHMAVAALGYNALGSVRYAFAPHILGIILAVVGISSLTKAIPALGVYKNWIRYPGMVLALVISIFTVTSISGAVERTQRVANENVIAFESINDVASKVSQEAYVIFDPIEAKLVSAGMSTLTEKVHLETKILPCIARNTTRFAECLTTMENSIDGSDNFELLIYRFRGINAELFSLFDSNPDCKTQISKRWGHRQLMAVSCEKMIWR